MAIIIPLLSLLGFTSIFSNAFKVRFVFSLPVVTSILVGTLFICSMCGVLYYATGLIILVGIAAQLYSLYAFPGIRKLILQYKTELICLVLITTAYNIFLQTRYLYCWDDLAFWSVFTKELILYHDIYPKNSLSSVLASHIHYPRGPSLFHYFMLYFCGFSDSSVLSAHFILQMLFLAPIMANRHFWHTILLVSLLFTFPVITSITTLHSIYNDTVISFIFSSSLMIFILEENKYKALWLAASILLFMPLFREIGLVLSLCAAIIICSDIIVNYRQMFKTFRSKILLFIGLSFLPFITYHSWFAYVEAHTIIGRNSHSAQRTLEIILSFFDKDSNSIKIAVLFIQALGKALVTKQFVCTYAIVLVTWYCISKYAKQYQNNFKTLLISSIAAFIIFLLWRLYLYIFVIDVYKMVNNPLISLESLVRYSISYVVIFYAMSCAYIQKTLFTRDIHSLGKYQTFALIVVTISIFSFIITHVLRMPELNNNNPETIFRKQAQYIYDLASKGFKIEYDYSLDNKITLAKRNKRCYSSLVYVLAPYYNDESRAQCVNQPMPDKDYISTIEHDKLNANINIDDILQTPEKYKCNIKYYPMYNHIDIICSEG